MEATNSSSALPEQHLATESFSYSWLVKPITTTTFSLDEEETTADDLNHINEEGGGRLMYQEENANGFPRTTTTTTRNNSFYFDFSIPNDPTIFSSYSSPLVHADELFSNGLILPTTASPALMSKQTTNPIFSTAAAAASSSSFFNIPPSTTPFRNIHHHHNQQRQRQVEYSPKKFRGVAYTKMVYKYLGCLLPGWFRRRTRVDDFNRRSALEIKSCSKSITIHNVSPPRISSASSSSAIYSTPTFTRTSVDDHTDSENSINDAILYCKKSSTGTGSVSSDR